MSDRHVAGLALAVVCAGFPVLLLAQGPDRTAPARTAPAAREVPVEREATPQAPAPPFDDGQLHVHGGARVRIGGDVLVPEGERVRDVVAVFGSVKLNGIADGNVVAVFGDVTVGPRGSAHGDVAAIGGRVIGAEGASIWGGLTELGWSMPPDLRLTFGDRNMTTVEVLPDWPRIARVQWWLALAGAALLAFFCACAVIAAPRAVDAGVQGSRPFLLALVVGLLLQVLGLPLLAGLSIALVASIIGIPLLVVVPILLFALAAMSVIGVTGFAVRVGYLLLPPSFRTGPSVLALIVGLMVTAGPALAGSYLWMASGGASLPALGLILLGTFIEYVWWTVGLGAGVMAWNRRRRAARLARAQAAPIDVPLPSGV